MVLCNTQVRGNRRSAPPASAAAAGDGDDAPAAPASPAPPAAPAAQEQGEPETTFYEGSGSPAELVVSLLLGATLLYLVRCPAALQASQLPVGPAGQPGGAARHPAPLPEPRPAGGCRPTPAAYPLAHPHPPASPWLQPLTIASVGRRLWIKYRFTDRRVVVTTSSPLVQREVQVAYSKIKEVRTAPRAFGAWGDMVSGRSGPGWRQRRRGAAGRGRRPPRRIPARCGRAGWLCCAVSAAGELLLRPAGCAASVVNWLCCLRGPQVIFLKDGARLELVGLERYSEIQDYIEGKLLAEAEP